MSRVKRNPDSESRAASNTTRRESRKCFSEATELLRVLAPLHGKLASCRLTFTENWIRAREIYRKFAYDKSNESIQTNVLTSIREICLKTNYLLN
ncbi:MAG: hypothetical protein JWN70_5985 [Planctomycetaceae bacterium]|nr:hypothetical protein [Planctomycetaceae bacterium]